MGQTFTPQNALKSACIGIFLGKMGSDKRAAHHPGKVKNRPAYCFTAIFCLPLRQKITPQVFWS